MHFNFVKGPKGDRVRFFQSSIPYLNNTSATVYKSGKTRKWRCDEPHPSRDRILRFSNGHYGIYFTIFNHELRREERVNFHESSNPLFVLVVPSDPMHLFMPEFFISKANQIIHNDISELKSVSHELLSTSSLFSPKRLLTLSTRGFSTSARNLDRDDQKQGNTQAFVEITDHSKPGQHRAEIREIPDEILEEVTEEPFESSFRKSQVNRIVSVFASHAAPADLNIIYPIYQSLKRNDLTLPSINEYNIVLKSIAMRSLDSDMSIESVESKLTCLLTVYQDVLLACVKNASCKPNNETFNIVLHEIFKGAVNTINLGSSSKIANDTYHAAFVKSEEFCQVGINLFMSVKDQNELDLNHILPNLITAANVHPNLLHKELVARLMDIQDIVCSEGLYYVGLINLSKYLKSLKLKETSEDVYNYISSVFDLYKEQVTSQSSLKQFEFQIYSAIIKSMIYNDNLNMATKFLDDVLLEFKSTLSLNGEKSIASQKTDVSNLISDYLQGIMGSGKTEDLNRSYNLLQKFKAVPYIPDVSVQVYNDMINRFISQYTLCEYEKVQGDAEIIARQTVSYNKIWELYERAAIRKDFQDGPIINPRSQNFGLEVNCRDFLLSLSLDLNDHVRITRLLKEIMVKNHVISDWNVSKKLCLYLYNGVAAYNNDYYANLLWSVIEQQGSHYFGNSKDLNGFLSEHVSFLMLENSDNAGKLLDSQTVFNAFSLFSLKVDNIYGLMSITNYLMYHLPKEPTFSMVFKLMQLQSYLINEFEDADNHYLQLSPELVLFKKALSQLFSQLHSLWPNMRVSDDISSACNSLNLVIAGQGSEVENVHHSDFVKDLSPLFSVSYPAAVTSFLENFKLGYKFNKLTWEAIINENFVFEVLEKNSLIKITEFIDRLTNLALDQQDQYRLLSSLVSLNNEKINIETLKFILKEKSDALSLNEFMVAVADFANISDNKYFLNIVCDNLEDIMSRNDGRDWLGKVFSKLISVGQLGKVSTLLEANQENLVYGLDVTNPTDEEFLKVVLMTYLNLGKSDKINAIFNHYFQGQQGNQILLKSNKLLECLINHYIATGAYDTVLSQFAGLQDRSSDMQQLIQFAQFMSCLTGSTSDVTIQQYPDANTVGLAILNEKNPLQMKEIFELNKLVVRNREQFFNFLIMCLTKASSLSGGQHSSEISSRFESVIKLCKVTRLNEISVSSLINIVKLLALTDSKRLLNILYNKFVNGSTLSPFVNLYFLQVDVLNKQDATALLNALQNALRQVGDQLNVDTVGQAQVA